MARALILAVSIVMATTSAPRADGGDAGAAAAGASIDDSIAEGRKLFDAQDYAAAIATLSPITRDVRATRSQRLAALEQIALAHFIRRDLASARSTFERILDIDPGYDLRDPSGSPELRTFFDDLKRELCLLYTSP